MGRRDKGWGSATWVWAGVLPVVCLLLSGCQNFFVCQKTSCTNGSSGTTTSSLNAVYAANTTSNNTSIAAYTISSSGFKAVTGSPFQVGYVPYAAAVSINNKFLYVGSLAGNLYLYSIDSTTGALTSPLTNPQAVTSSASLSAMAISPDGAFLFALDIVGGVLTEYKLDTSAGTLSLAGTFTVPATNSGCAAAGTPLSQSCSIAVSPVSNSSGFVAVALGSAGTVVYPYTTSGGITASTYTGVIAPASASSGDFSLAFDSNRFLHIARTLSVTSFGSVANATPAMVGSIAYASGATPRSVTVLGTYLYTANKGVGTISGYSISSAGALTALANSPTTGPGNVSALAVDSSGTYVVAAGYDTSAGLQIFKPSSGVLGTSISNVGTGASTTVPNVIATTH